MRKRFDVLLHTVLTMGLVVSSGVYAGRGPGPGGAAGPGGSAGSGAPGGSGNVPAPAASFETSHFSGSARCGDCHNGLTDRNGEDVSLEFDWAVTPMANAVRGPFWQAKVASELARNPQLADLINDKCSRCHAPMANVEMHADGMPISILDGPAPGDGFLDPLHPYHEAAMDGVSCTLCHQIEDDGNLGTLKGFSGHFTIAEHEVPENRSAYGPVPWPRTNPMRAEASFTPTYAPHIAESALCATCHDLRTPYVDARGETASGPPETEFPEQVPYTEWENSSFGPGGVSERNCQACHMPPAEGVRLANRPRRLQRVDHFSRHVFVGANTTMLDILDRNRDELGVTATGFEEAIERNRDLLASAADIQVLDASLAADELLVRVKINNHSGHKLPTSFPSRRVWVHFVARGPKGEVLFESGRLNPDGSIEGVDADRDLSRYEPHHRVITEPGQVQVYEPVMGNTDGEVTYTLLRAAQFIKDNRLTPRGFLKERVPEDVRVAGRAAADRDFDDGSDIIEYRLSVRPGKYVDVEIDLNYQTVAHSFLRDLYLDDGLPEVARFREIFENGAIVAENIASTSVRVRR